MKIKIDPTQTQQRAYILALILANKNFMIFCVCKEDVFVWSLFKNSWSFCQCMISKADCVHAEYSNMIDWVSTHKLTYHEIKERDSYVDLFISDNTVIKISLCETENKKHN